MRLADYIESNVGPIAEQWEKFAATRLPAADRMQPLELRDHVEELLRACVADLRTVQTQEQQSAKSKGLAPTLPNAPETAAQTHAILRAKHGFDIKQLASEYRALRASVLRLWLDAYPPDPSALEDMGRFNEAIDQALAESVAFFSYQVERARNLLLGMLAHDMRTPLQTIQLTARALADLNADVPVSRSAERLIASGARIQYLLDDLVDFSRMQLGLGIRVMPYAANLEAVCREELDQIRAAHPGRRVELTVTGDCSGSWDARRLRQVVSNLVVNALKYGRPQEPVRVELEGADNHVRIKVRNAGSLRDTSGARDLFEPLTRGAAERSDEAGSSLGLGLYIVKELVRAHGGDVDASSNDGETVFTVSLPRDSSTVRGVTA
jgi:signal transduction histidine kinase